MQNELLKNSWLRWLLIFALWTLIGLSFASQLYLSRSKIGSPVTWNFAFERALADWYVFAVLSIPALWLARRFRIERGNWVRNLVLHLAGCAAFSIGWMVLRAAVEQWENRGAENTITFAAAFSHALVATFFFNLLIYWVIVSVSHMVAFYAKFQEREFRAAELEKHLVQAKLQALQMQLNPHFLFNTLHAISSLMHKDVEAADRMIARLSELLRYALESTDAQEVTLRQELHFLERYLEIEQTRFGARLTVRQEIASDTLDALVPNLVLQPLVENAIQHGIEPHAKPGVIELRARHEPGVLHLEVIDNGSGLAPGQSVEEGVGLSNTRARLEQLYPGAHRFEFANGARGGLVVTVSIPWRASSNGPAVIARE